MERDVPRLVGAHGQRNPDNPVVEDVEAGRFGIEAEFVAGRNLIDDSPQFVRVADDGVGMRGILSRAESFVPGLRVLRLRCRLLPGRRVGEQVALSGESGLACGGRFGAGDLRKLRLGRLTRPLGKRLGRREVVQVIEESPEIELGEEGFQLVDLRGADGQILLPERDGHVQADGGEPLRQEQLFAPGGDVLALLPPDLLHVFEDILHRAPGLDQFAGALLADTRHAGNVIRRIPPQGQDVPHQTRVVDAVFFADGRPIDDFDPVGAFLLVDAAAVADQLPVILVGGDHVNFVTRLRSLDRKGADHVVGLIAGHLQHGDAHGLDDPFDIGHRIEDVFGRGRAVGFVFGVNLPPERAARGVESHAEQVGVLALLDIAQEFGESEHHRGIHPGPVAHGAPEKGIVILENQCIGIDQKEFFHRRSALSSAYHSAYEAAVSCNLSAWSSTPAGSPPRRRQAKSASMFSHVGW